MTQPSHHERATKLAIVNTVISAATLAAMCFGFLSVSHQIEQSRATMLTEVSDKVYTRMHEIHALFLEHPELRAYFYHGKENSPPTDDTDALRHQRVEQTAELLVDFFHQIIITLDSIPAADRSYRPEMYEDLRYGWTCYIKDVFKQSPALREFYMANRPWYTSNRLASEIFESAEKERAGLVQPQKECLR